MSGSNGQPVIARRGIAPGARGGAAFWLMAAALGVAVLLVLGLIGLIAVRGSQTFWPKPVVMVELWESESGERETLLGLEIAKQVRPAATGEFERLEALALQKSEGDESEAERLVERWTAGGEGVRERLLQTGNRDLLGSAFRWVPEYRIRLESAVDDTLDERARDAVLVERTTAWGLFLGELEAIEIGSYDGSMRGIVSAGGADAIDGDALKIEADFETLLAAAQEAVAWASARNAEIVAKEKADRTPLTRALSEADVTLRRVELAHAESAAESGRALGIAVWIVVAAGAVGLVVVAFVLGRQSGQSSPLWVRGAWRVCVVAAVMLGMLAVFEHPWSVASVSDEELAAARDAHQAEVSSLQDRASEVDADLAAMRAELENVRIVVRDPLTGRAAPASIESDAPMLAGQVVRIVAPNRLDSGGKWKLYRERWGEFITADPRENGAGGVFPVIIGTVTLTLLLTIAVAPLGVLAAIYLREYARQGVLTSAIRIAINNLAGVPSIVYGVFGLGFFCYTVGKYVDEGPTESLAVGNWWTLLGVLGIVIVFALAMGASGRTMPGRPAGFIKKWAGRLAGLSWVAAVIIAAALIARTPYFGGAFVAEDSLGRDVMQGRGILWASLTLALLTLPVVIVSTEEAIAAVPNSQREGSLGCGASKWQTVRRIVLPGALPGILTGSILAIARGAGEVAPLMLVGAAKLAKELPVSGEFPYVHGDRSFMHLGYHIYDVGFKSPDADAARPLVWTITLLLIAIVLGLNLAAILLRARLGSNRQAAM